MKRLILASVIGALLIFIWQFLSFALLDLHRPASQYTPKQNEILNYLSSQLPEEGGYMVPNLPEGASMDQNESFMKEYGGKPWAIISYHKAMKIDMTMNMIRGFLVNIFMVGLFAWLLSKTNFTSIGQFAAAGIAVGFIVFFNVPYTNHIWYQTFDLNASLMDALISWILAGITIGFFYRKKTAN